MVWGAQKRTILSSSCSWCGILRSQRRWKSPCISLEEICSSAERPDRNFFSRLFRCMMEVLGTAAAAIVPFSETPEQVIVIPEQFRDYSESYKSSLWHHSHIPHTARTWKKFSFYVEHEHLSFVVSPLRHIIRTSGINICIFYRGKTCSNVYFYVEHEHLFLVTSLPARPQNGCIRYLWKHIFRLWAAALELPNKTYYIDHFGGARQNFFNEEYSLQVFISCKVTTERKFGFGFARTKRTSSITSRVL